MNLTPSNQIIISLVVSFFVFFSARADVNLINFSQMNLDEARRSGKSIMVSFSADWCLPCKQLESSLYSDNEVADLVNSNFQPVKINVDLPLVESWNDSYNIDYLPTILFTDSSGIEFERINKVPSRDEFLDILKRVIKLKKAPLRAHHSITQSNPIAESTLFNSYERFIQLGAFSTPEAADRRVQALNYIGGHYRIIAEETNGRILYKVLLNENLSATNVNKKIKEYNSKGFEAFLRSY